MSFKALAFNQNVHVVWSNLHSLKNLKFQQCIENKILINLVARSRFSIGFHQNNKMLILFINDRNDVQLPRRVSRFWHSYEKNYTTICAPNEDTATNLTHFMHDLCLILLVSMFGSSLFDMFQLPFKMCWIQENHC